MRFIILLTILATAILLPRRSDINISSILLAARQTAEATTQAAPTKVPATAAATATPEAIPTQTQAGDCQSPPPWSDQATAERCHTHYPPPFDGAVIEHCQVTSELSYLMCTGYWLIPGASYPLLTQTPVGGLPTLQPVMTVTPLPPASPTPDGYPPPSP